MIFTVPENATTTTITNAPKDDEVEKEEFYQNDEIEEDLFSDLETNDYKGSKRHKRSPPRLEDPDNSLYGSSQLLLIIRVKSTVIILQ